MAQQTSVKANRTRDEEEDQRLFDSSTRSSCSVSVGKKGRINLLVIFIVVAFLESQTLLHSFDYLVMDGFYKTTDDVIDASAPASFQDKSTNHSLEVAQSSSLPAPFRNKSTDNLPSPSSPALYSNKSNVRLEFLHIPKNAGTFIEDMGIQYNISWGACHFQFPWKRRNKNLRYCPAMISRFPQSKKALWHYSLTQVDEIVKANKWRMSPYDRISIHDPRRHATKKEFFIVARHPFTRLLSLWGNHYLRERSAAKINQYIQNIFTSTNSSVYDMGIGNWFPKCQTTYLKEPKGRMVHVIHMEYLKTEFNALMEAFDYSPRIGDTHRKVNSGGAATGADKLTVDHLTNKTIQLIHDSCPDDFQLGPYSANVNIMYTDEVLRKKYFEKKQQK